MSTQPRKEKHQQRKNGEEYLETTFQNSGSNETRHILEGQLRECYGRVVYSHKTHEKCTDLLLSRQAVIKNWQIVLSALTTGGFLSAFLGTGNVGAAIGATLSMTLLVLNAYTKNYDLGELAQKHKQAANNIWLDRKSVV